MVPFYDLFSYLEIICHLEIYEQMTIRGLNDETSSYAKHPIEIPSKFSNQFDSLSGNQRCFL